MFKPFIRLRFGVYREYWTGDSRINETHKCRG
jgi:hypothetical protein